MAKNDFHSGHRKRIDSKARIMGLEFLEEHEQLEKMLFAVIPRGNTNDIAHKLLDEFGSIYGVLTADVEQLKAIDDVGLRTAEFLHDLLPLFGIAERAMLTKNDSPALNTTQKICDYVKTLFYGKVVENFYMISLSQSGRVIRFDKISEGTALSTEFSVHMVARKAILNEAYAVVLAHNHPGGKCSPSMADRDMTKSISEALDKLGIALTDHVIVATGECYSMKENTVY